MKRALLAGLVLVTGCASTRAPVTSPTSPTQAALDRPSVRSVQAHVSHFDVFERFFAEDYARFKSEARAANSTREQDGWTVSGGTSCTEALDATPDAVIFEDPWFALGEDTFGQAIAISEFMGTCRLPDDAKAEICVAVKDGAARGVTVSVVNASEDTAKCIDRGVRALAFPSTGSSRLAGR